MVKNPTLRDRELKRRFQDLQSPQQFSNFDRCFGPDVGTPVIYHEVVRPITRKACIDGINGSILMYG